jgi:hypothetical protein
MLVRHKVFHEHAKVTGYKTLDDIPRIFPSEDVRWIQLESCGALTSLGKREHHVQVAMG